MTIYVADSRLKFVMLAESADAPKFSSGEFIQRLRDMAIRDRPDVLFLSPAADLVEGFSERWRCFVNSLPTAEQTTGVWFGDALVYSSLWKGGRKLINPEFGICRSLYDCYALRNPILRLSQLPDELISNVETIEELFEQVTIMVIRGELSVSKWNAIVTREVRSALRPLYPRPWFVDYPQLGMNFEYMVNSLGTPTAGPVASNPQTVSIIIPTRGDSRPLWGSTTSLVINAIESIVATRGKQQLEFIIVHDENERFASNKQLASRAFSELKFIKFSEPFNFSRKCNLGAVHASGDVLIFVNDDVEARDSWWIDHLCGLLEVPNVGAVGPLLILEDGRIQSAGHIDNPLPTNYGAGLPIRALPPLEPADHPREVSSISAAVFAIRRTTFDEVGGFSDCLPNNFNDVDICLKVRSIGKTVVWTPLTSLVHFESLSRDSTVTEGELRFLRRRWGRLFTPDQTRYRFGD